ncbi:aminotransferase class I/II-fold pyridoxal phosphate-dependent enzyme [Methanothrix sp.]|uniref:aminotransferase class I/II-fold pyridoxal phosphate-dependent enzyme n=1 Tax=Methanothrix sp. TaxID=90426 RepID=UPI003296CEA6
MNLQKHVSLNINVRGLGESPTLAINERVKLLQGQGKKIYNFGLGQSPFPVPAPVVEALRLHAHEKDYLPVKGLSALKEAVASETYTSVSAPIQYAGVQAFQGSMAIERYLWNARRILSTLGQKCYRMLADAGVRVHEPEGAFYMFPDFSPFSRRLAKKNVPNSTMLCERLLQEKGVAMLPGRAFERPLEELSARISYINFAGNRSLAAGETIPPHQELPAEFIQAHCEDTLMGIEAIVDWLEE